ncbi:MAG: glycoside hydrolase family 99-like domain-containing protein [Bacillota bacterium]|nr:glycoside hydrolase family 99-like domain-containing protein [Bacillota bacterium]
MQKVKLLIRNVCRGLLHSLPLKQQKKQKFKNLLYRNLGFLIRNTEMYKAWRLSYLNYSNIETKNLISVTSTMEHDKYKEIVLLSYLSSSEKSKEFISLSEENVNLTEEDIKLIAFYLPQFHPFKENDDWWGRGFSEWTNVTKAKPQFTGHHQPQLPIDVGFYDLRCIDVMKRQIELAKQYGVYGFCFHHYWFGGKRLMEKPVDNYLEHKELNFPFCLCWANENWTRRWDGLEQDILIGQKHSPEDDLAFIKDLSRYLSDYRYIKVEGKPLVILYRPQILPNPRETVKRWREYCRESGIGEIFLVGAKTFGLQDPTEFGFDAAVEFPPHVMFTPEITESIEVLNPNFEGIIYDYKHHVKSKGYLNEDSCLTFKTVSPGWDNTARKPNKGHIFYGSNPALYKEWLINVIDHTKQKNNNQFQFVFINAWNEWAEGAHLEPDRRYGYGYLQATSEAILETRKDKTKFSESINQDLVTIIAPAFNHEKYIEECIYSSANQTHKNKELIIIDDCSKDNTPKIINKIIETEKIKSEFPGGITYIKHSKNKGAHASINEGLKVAKGKYITIINTDDLYETNRLEVMINCLKEKNADLAFSKVSTIDGNGEVCINEEGQYYNAIQEEMLNHPNINIPLFRQNVAISTGNMLFTKELIDKIGEFKDYKYIHDWDFILRATLKKEPIFVPKTTYLYRLHESNSFKELSKNQELTNAEVEDVLGNLYKKLFNGDYDNSLISEVKNHNNYSEELK